MINPLCCSASCHRCEITKCVTAGFLADFRELRRYFHRFPLTGRLINEVIKSFNREETKDFFYNEEIFEKIIFHKFGNSESTVGIFVELVYLWEEKIG